MVGDLRPILATLIFCGIGLVFVLFSIVVCYCCCRSRKTSHQRLPSPEIGSHTEIDIPQSLLHPPSVNPYYVPTPRLARASAPAYQYPNSSMTDQQHSRSSFKGSTVPPPHADSGPPTYDEVIGAGLEYPLTSQTNAGGSGYPELRPTSSSSNSE